MIIIKEMKKEVKFVFCAKKLKDELLLTLGWSQVMRCICFCEVQIACLPFNKWDIAIFI